MRWINVAAAVLWLLTAAIWVAAGKEWWVPLGAFAASFGFAISEWQIKELKRQNRTHARRGGSR